MFRKTLLLLPTLLIGMLLTATAQSATLTPLAAESAEWHGSPEQMHERIKSRLDKLHERLEISATQQTAWNAFAATMEALPAPHATPPGPNADAAAILHFRAELATEMANRLSVMADATDKLEAVLTADQRKILAEESPHAPRSGHP